MRGWSFGIGFLVVVACGGKTDGTDGGSNGDDGGTTPVYGNCTSDPDCIVTPKSCCGSCGAATKSDEIAVAKSKASDYRMTVCKSTACPACAGMQDPSLKARCTNNMCEIAP